MTKPYIYVNFFFKKGKIMKKLLNEHDAVNYEEKGFIGEASSIRYALKLEKFYNEENDEVEKQKIANEYNEILEWLIS